jgi:hypothetical protein
VSRAYDKAVWRKGVRPAVLLRDGFRCQVETAPGRICGRRARDAGHVRALIEGGEPYQLGNLQAQCSHHNGIDARRLAPALSRHGRAVARMVIAGEITPPRWAVSAWWKLHERDLGTAPDVYGAPASYPYGTR